MRFLSLAVVMLAAVPAVSWGQSRKCKAPDVDPADTHVSAQVRYEGRLTTTYDPPIDDPATGLPMGRSVVPIAAQTFDFALGYDAHGRLVVQQTLTSPEPVAGASRTGTLGELRSFHVEGDTLVLHDESCSRIVSAPSGLTAASPLSLIPPGGSVARGFLVRDRSRLEAEGRTETVGGGVLRVIADGDAKGGVSRVSREFAQNARGEWQLRSTNVVSEETNERDGRRVTVRTEQTLQFDLVDANVNELREAERATAAASANAPTPARGAQAPIPLIRDAHLGAPPAGGSALVYQSGQAAPNILFQHGIFSSGAAWNRMDGWLGQQFQFGTVVRPSLQYLERIDTQRDQLAGLLDQLGAQRYIAIAHSQGGMVARRLGQQRPELLQGVVTLSSPNNGAYIAKSSRQYVTEQLQRLGDRLYDGCQSPFDDPGCLLWYLLAETGTAYYLTNLAFDAALPVTHDEIPDSAFVQTLNTTPESFVRVGVENVANSRWVEFRFLGDLFCNPEAGCGGRAWASYTGAAYAGFRTCTVLATIWGYPDIAALCNKISGAMDAIDDFWNKLYSNNQGGDGFVDLPSQIYTNAQLRRTISSADSHVGVTKSDKTRDAVAQILDSQFQVPRRAGGASTVASVSAASYAGDLLAPESIVAAFGQGLATQTVAASTLPLPTVLGGTTVTVRDGAGVDRLAPLFFVSEYQVNYLLPAGSASGMGTVTVRAPNGNVRTGVAVIGRVAPAFFTANSSGSGVVSGSVLRVRPDGSQSTEPLSRFDALQNKYVAVPVDLGPPGERVFLVLSGTGMRGQADLSRYTLSIGGVGHPIAFAGAQGTFAGLDQMNVELSPALRTAGEVFLVLAVDGQPANIVSIQVN